MLPAARKGVSVVMIAVYIQGHNHKSTVPHLLLFVKNCHQILLIRISQKL